MAILDYLMKAGSINISDWIKNNPDKGYEYLIYEESEVDYPSVKTYNNQVCESFKTKSEKIPSFYARSIKNGKGFTQNGMALSPDNVAFTDYTTDIKHPLRNKMKYKFNNAEKLSGKVAICSVEPNNLNYFHWMLEIFPRINLIQKSGLEVDKYIISNEKPFQKYLLELIGIKENQVINYQPNRLIQAEELIIPDMLNNFEYIQTNYGYYYNTRYFPAWIADFYKNLVLPHLTKSNPERIYISRKSTDHRRITNEPEVQDYLRPLGFKTYYLEEMSFIEQAQLFYNAEAIIAPHGAGLVNQIFCDNKVKIIEIFPYKYLCNSLQIISRALNHNYTYILGNSVKNKLFDEDWLLVEDVYTEIEKLDKAVKFMGI